MQAALSARCSWFVVLGFGLGVPIKENQLNELEKKMDNEMED